MADRVTGVIQAILGKGRFIDVVSGVGPLSGAAGRPVLLRGHGIWCPTASADAGRAGRDLRRLIRLSGAAVVALQSEGPDSWAYVVAAVVREFLTYGVAGVSWRCWPAWRMLLELAQQAPDWPTWPAGARCGPCWVASTGYR